MTTNQQVEVGTKILFRAVLIFLGLGLLYLIRDIIAITFLAIIVSASLSPSIRWVRDRGLPRPLSVIFVYFSVLFAFGFLISLIIPPLASQIGEFANDIPRYAERVAQMGRYFDTHYMIDTEAVRAKFDERVAGFFSGIFSTTVGLFSGLISFIVFFFLSLYISLEENGIEKFLVSITPRQYREYSISLARRIQSKISQWLMGQLILMFSIFAIYFVGLSLLGVPYALTLALIGGALEIIPYVGPIMAAVPAIFMSFLVSPLLGLAVAVFYTVAHQVESHVITPQVMKRAVGVNPVAIILSLLIGAELGGILGVILAVPAAAVIRIFVEDFLEKKRL